MSDQPPSQPRPDDTPLDGVPLHETEIDALLNEAEALAKEAAREVGDLAGVGDAAAVNFDEEPPHTDDILQQLDAIDRLIGTTLDEPAAPPATKSDGAAKAVAGGSGGAEADSAEAGGAVTDVEPAHLDDAVSMVDSASASRDTTERLDEETAAEVPEDAQPLSAEVPPLSAVRDTLPEATTDPFRTTPPLEISPDERAADAATTTVDETSSPEATTVSSDEATRESAAAGAVIDSTSATDADQPVNADAAAIATTEPAETTESSAAPPIGAHAKETSPEAAKADETSDKAAKSEVATEKDAKADVQGAKPAKSDSKGAKAEKADAQGAKGAKPDTKGAAAAKPETEKGKADSKAAARPAAAAAGGAPSSADDLAANVPVVKAAAAPSIRSWGGRIWWLAIPIWAVAYLFILLDKPFARLSAETKGLLGKLALITLLMAGLAWTMPAFLNKKPSSAGPDHKAAAEKSHEPASHGKPAPAASSGGH